VNEHHGAPPRMPRLGRKPKKVQGPIVLVTDRVEYERKGSWFQTFTNKQFWPCDPRVEDVCMEDIANALSCICRFGGHLTTHYSVAQHSVLVSDHLPWNLAAQGLMHDASEAYLGDVISPLKPFLSGYDEMESRVMRCIGEAFGLVLEPLPSAVHEADSAALHTEKRDLRGPAPAPWCSMAPPWPERITPWPQEKAKAEFLNRARRLGIP
jgi:5'-nucleotidase